MLVIIVDAQDYFFSDFYIIHRDLLEEVSTEVFKKQAVLYIKRISLVIVIHPLYQNPDYNIPVFHISPFQNLPFSPFLRAIFFFSLAHKLPSFHFSSPS